MVALMKEHEFPYPFSTYWFGDNHVYWRIPITSFADIDKIMEELYKLEKKSAAEYKTIQDTLKGSYESQRLCVYALDYKYSMIAEKDKNSTEEKNFIFFDIYYLAPGHDAEIENLFEEYKAFMADKEIIQSWYTYWGYMGTDNPVLVSATQAKNAREFYEENAKMWKDLGKEAGKIKNKMMKYVTKQEQKRAWFQKELSYTPTKKDK